MSTPSGPVPSVTFDHGALNDGDNDLFFDYTTTGYGEEQPKVCEHAIDVKRDPPYPDGRISNLWTWKLPIALCCYNEGGHCATTVCIFCLFDAIRRLPTREQS